jgi:hypothetical protein
MFRTRRVEYLIGDVALETLLKRVQIRISLRDMTLTLTPVTKVTTSTTNGGLVLRYGM